MTESYYVNQMSTNKKKIWIAVGIVLLVVALGAAWYFIWGRGDKVDSVYSYFKLLPELSESSMAKIPEGFPRHLILGSNIEVLNGSKSAETEPGKTVYSLELRADSHPGNLYAEYEEYLSGARWNIKDHYMGATNGSIVAERFGSTLMLTFAPENRATAVMLELSAPN